MKSNGIYMCPAFDETCPYCKKGFCHMAVETGTSPIGECEACEDWLALEDGEEL